MPSTLIIIRGNSGSGKTTVAKEVRNRLGSGLSDNTLLVQQDVFRRDILREKDATGKYAALELIKLVVDFGRRQGRIVIVEGIFSKKKYGAMLRDLMTNFDNVHAYYFDIPFEETLKRHTSKPNSHEFGEQEMREWWKEKDYLGTSDEKILHKDMSVDEVVNQIINDTQLLLGSVDSPKPHSDV